MMLFRIRLVTQQVARGVVFVCTLPTRRAREMRDDDRAQVLVLTGVMVFVVAIMGVTTFNAGTLLYNRVRGQNAVDAAADSFALYQARGLNLSQHLNDIHYLANWVAFGAEAVVWGIRIVCPLASIRPPPQFFDFNFYRNCCSWTRDGAKVIDEAQDGLASIILETQGVIDVAFPIIGAVSANSLAEANGADPVVNWFGEVVGQLAGIFGADASGFEDAFNSLGDVPIVGDVYVLPWDFGQLISLNTEEKDPDPDFLPWDTLGILSTMATLSDVSCLASGEYATEELGGDEPDHGYGWREDTFYCGGPAYNTWMAGLVRHNAFPFLERTAWLNPTIGPAADQEVDFYTHQDDYGTFDHRLDVSGAKRFRNPAFFTIASSQVDGSPLMERSSHDEFVDFSSPALISVHTGNPGTDTLPSTLFIWH